VEPAGTPFTGQPTYTGGAVTANGNNLQLNVIASGLKDGAYHWQARDVRGSQASSWVTFSSSGTATDFTVETTPPTAPTVSTIGGVTVANPTVVTSNEPAISGTSVAGASIKVSVVPDSQTFTTTADASGNWSVTPGTAIPNGQYELSVVATDPAGNASTATQVALTINPATAAQTAPTPAATGTPAATTTAPAGSSNLAQTGDNTDAVSVASLLVLLLAGAGLIWMRRRYVIR